MVMQKTNEIFPDWKLNIKHDNDRYKFNSENRGNQGGHQNHNRFNNQGGDRQYGGGHNNSMERNQGYGGGGNMGGHMGRYQQQGGYGGQSYGGMDNRGPRYSEGGYQNNPMGGGGYDNFNSRPQGYPNRGHMGGYQGQFGAQGGYGHTSEPEQIVGEKQCRIFVREIWLGGIPEMCDKSYMHQLMSEFGMVENLEIFPKFAFIKFRIAEQATVAFERAERISMMFNNPPGFRIYFSDPLRRANIVSNHYEYDRQSPFLPILFLGFPPVTSATIDMGIMKSVCEKYGEIVNCYMRKNANNQTRSYFLFTYSDIKTALRAKIELNKRRDLLGDKRVEVTLLLDEEVILRGKFLSYTEKMFQGKTQATDPEGGLTDPNKAPNFQAPQRRSQERASTSNERQNPRYNMGYPPQQMQPQGYGGMYGQPSTGGSYQGDYSRQGYGNRMNPQQEMYYEGMQPSSYPPYGEQKGGQQPKPQGLESGNVQDILQSVLDPNKGSSETSKDNSTSVNQSGSRPPQSKDPYEKVPNKPTNSKESESATASDLLGKLLNDNDEGEIKDKDQSPNKKEEDNERNERGEPAWSGFLTWKGQKRVGVDGHTQFKEPEDYVINILHQIDPKELILKEKQTMILEPTNSISEPLFKEYAKMLREKVGVSFTSHSLIYIMGRSQESDKILKIRDNELLVVMEKPSLSSLIKDKLQKAEELKV